MSIEKAKWKSYKLIVLFIASTLIWNSAGAQELNFSITRVCMDTLAPQSDGLNPICISFIIRARNFSGAARRIFFRSLNDDSHYGRLIFYYPAEKKYYFSLVVPMPGYTDAVHKEYIDIRQNDSIDFVALVHLSDLSFSFNSDRLRRLVMKKTAATFKDMAQNGSFYYLPGAFKEDVRDSDYLPEGTISVKKENKLLYNSSCLLSTK